MRVTGDWLSRASILREVDSYVDIARGWLQLRILLVLGESGSCSVDELVSKLGERRKAILDALRKMRSKGLVSAEDNPSLTELGSRVFEQLYSVLTCSSFSSPVALKSLVYDVPRDLARLFYLYEVLVALGTSKKYELPLSALCYVTKLKPETLEDYLKPYGGEELKLLKRVLKNRKFFFFSRKAVCYRLTDDGVKVFHRLPDYVKYRSSFGARLLSLATKSGHPKVILKRVSLILSLGSTAATLLAAAL
ncbi:MAG: hypothetical protein N3E43_06990, partial [Sulfolobales archaeon]|nr:hypothetical protein [Sulfolobales archaeon]